MKSKIFIFTTLILVVFLFVITSCNYFLNGNNNTTININLDLSKIVKTSRNETTSNSTEYILKVFAYNAASYKPKDEIENLPLLTQTENKVDINGNVKARLDVTIGLNVIFVAKLYQGEAEEPLYAGKSEVIKIKTTNNKVHLVLTRENVVPKGFVLVKGTTITGAEIWTPTSNVFVSGRSLTIPDLIVSDHEVTRGEYKDVMGSDPSKADAYDKDGNKLTGEGVLNNPVNYVSWYDTLVYCNKLSIKENLKPCYSIDGSTNPDDWGEVPYSNNDPSRTTWDAATCDFEANGYRLPTEAEWEWLARGGENFEYAGSDNVDAVAWSESNTKNTGTREVKTKAQNGYRLYDMSGNVWELCYDWYGESISDSTVADGTTSGSTRVCRGGCWWDNDDNCQVAYRYDYYPNNRIDRYGFRVVRTATEVIDHTHKFSTDWTSNSSGHWHAATCEHTDETSGFEEHTFGEYVSNNDATTEADGTKTRECSACGYGETVVDEGSKIIGPEMVFVRGGTVTGELPVWLDESALEWYRGVFIKDRTVTLSDFYMGKYAVTQEEYASVMEGQKVTVEGVEYNLESNPSYCTKDSTKYTLFSGDEQEKRPVEGVTWYDAVWYCNALSEKEGLTKAYNIEVTEVKKEDGKENYYIYTADVSLVENANGYRLPTEAEWEFAARGGDPTKADWNYVFSGANTAEGVSYDSLKNAGLDSVGWYCYNSINGTTGDTKPSSGEQGYGTHQVGKKAPNRLGLYDMSGNVDEWCYDWLGNVNTGEESDPTGATSGDYRVSRGGGWVDSANFKAVAFRGNNYPNTRHNYYGFRVVRTATE